MNRKYKLLAYLMVLFGVFLIVGLVAYGSNMAVLNPKGVIAHHERNLLFFGVALSALIVIPVFVMTFVIAWKYRADNHKARYQPNWDRSKKAEATWWLIPLALITILSVITWKSSHDLDPFKPIASSAKPLEVQVVALQWRWLFIYPEQGFATVNDLTLPVNTPINFKITSDAPMNSFWIPQLGGQIYAMPGMSTKLHLLASEVGDYNGSSANISGEGFADMRFVTHVVPQNQFDTWAQDVQAQPKQLTEHVYNDLSAATEDTARYYYAAVDVGLYDDIVMKYMMPGHALPTPEHHGGHE